MRKLSVLMLALFMWVSNTYAANENNPDPLVTFLEEAQSAASTLDYSGYFTYQQGAVVRSSRIVHLLDATGERERIEILDGEPREYLRHNDTTRSLLPEHELIIIEPRHTLKFPSVLRGNLQLAAKYYELHSKNKVIRVAGRDCNVFTLIPRDSHRYGYVLCTDVQSNLLLRLQTINDQNEVIDQIMFVSVTVGEAASKANVETSWKTESWREVEIPMLDVDLNSNGWRIPHPPGFEVLSQVSRPLRGDYMVSQLVLSDGIAALSVFVEPFNPDTHVAASQGGVHTGAISIYRKRIADSWVTVLGQVPADTVRSIAEHIEYVPLAH